MRILKAATATLLLTAFATGASAKSASQMRVYINPGHGGWTSDDRPMNVIGHTSYSDTTSFFETNTNLQKSFGMMEKLIEMGVPFNRSWGARNLGNNIVLSRVKNGGNNDRDLLEVSAEAQNNNFDFFISIHSNAATEGTNTNYPLLEHHGYDSPQNTLQTNSRVMAQKVWPHLFENSHQHWTYYSMSNMNVRGEISFNQNSWSAYWANGYLACLGVMHHAVPGYLAEGYFHTYQPARHRAMNWDVCRVEGTAYARGVADYFGFAKDATGIIYGIVRDGEEQFSHSLYKPNTGTTDKYKPINGAVVTLKQGNNVVKQYVTDNYYNGAFVFFVNPGSYTVEVSCNGYKTTTESYTVSASQTIYPEVWLYKGSGSISGDTTFENYPDPLKDTGLSGQSSYTFQQEYVDVNIPEMSGRVPRRVIARNGKLYVLAVNAGSGANPVIFVYDTKGRKVLTQASLSGFTAGSSRYIGDIALTADGYLVACNEQFNQFSDGEAANAGVSRGYVRVYKWDNDAAGLPTGNPKEMFSSSLSANYYRVNVGHSMSYSGTLTKGKIVMAAINVYPGGSSNILYNYYTISNGGLAGSSYANDVLTDYSNYGSLGELFTVTTSPGHPDYVCINSRFNHESRQFYTDFNSHSMTSYCTVPTGNLGINSYGVGYFRYGNHNYMVVPDNDASNNNKGVKLLCCSDYGNATRVSIGNANIASKGCNGYTAADGEGEVVRDADGNAIAAYMNLYLIRDAKITKFTTRPQEKFRREYAYRLSGSLVDPQHFTFNYSLTGDARDVTIVLTPRNGGATLTYPQGAKKAGSNSVTLDLKELQANIAYDWAVRVTSKTIPAAAEYFAENSGITANGGVVTVTDPETDAFGTVTVTHGLCEGVDVYDPTGKKIATRVHKGNSVYGNNSAEYFSMRGAEIDGKIVNASWGRAGKGLVVFDPANPNSAPYSMFRGSMSDAGHFVLNGTNLGGCPSGVNFAGSGNNVRMYTFDWAFGNNLMRYDLGADRSISRAPVQLGHSAIMANTNVDIVPAGNGVFLSQVRFAPNNVTDCPGFIYVADADNAIKYNSGVLNGNGLNSSNSGLAVSKDGKTLAVADCEGHIKIFDLGWNGNTPTLSYRYDINIGVAVQFSHMRFDYAGNLHTYQRENGGYHMYVLPGNNPVVSTPARVANAVYTSNPTGVNDIAVDAADDNVRYFNLNGVEMPADTDLQPGMYIRIRNNKAEKVIIK